MDWFTGFLSKFGMQLLALIGVLGAAFGLRQAGKSAGKQEVEVKETKKALTRAVKSKEIENEVSEKSSDDLDADLDKWMRD